MFGLSIVPHSRPVHVTSGGNTFACAGPVLRAGSTVAYPTQSLSPPKQHAKVLYGGGLSWFKQLYGFEFEEVLSDNGPEFKGTFERGQPFGTFCDQTGIKHRLTRPYRPQTNGKVEAFFSILKREFFRLNEFRDMTEVREQLGSFLFEYNHLRRHGGLDYITPCDKLEEVTELVSYNSHPLFVAIIPRCASGYILLQLCDSHDKAPSLL